MMSEKTEDKKCEMSKHAYRCHTCGQRFQSGVSRNEHQRRSHQQVTIIHNHVFTRRSGMFHCCECSKPYLSSRGLRAHITKVHGKENRETSFRGRVDGTQRTDKALNEDEKSHSFLALEVNRDRWRGDVSSGETSSLVFLQSIRFLAINQTVKALVCVACGCLLQVSSVNSHLKRVHFFSIKGRLSRLLHQELDGFELENKRIPPHFSPIEGVRIRDGYKCCTCGYIAGHKRTKQQHALISSHKHYQPCQFQRLSMGRCRISRELRKPLNFAATQVSCYSQSKEQQKCLSFGTAGSPDGIHTWEKVSELDNAEEEVETEEIVDDDDVGYFLIEEHEYMPAKHRSRAETHRGKGDRAETDTVSAHRKRKDQRKRLHAAPAAAAENTLERFPIRPQREDGRVEVGDPDSDKGQEKDEDLLAKDVDTLLGRSEWASQMLAMHDQGPPRAATASRRLSSRRNRTAEISHRSHEEEEDGSGQVEDSREGRKPHEGEDGSSKLTRPRVLRHHPAGVRLLASGGLEVASRHRSFKDNEAHAAGPQQSPTTFSPRSRTGSGQKRPRPHTISFSDEGEDFPEDNIEDNCDDSRGGEPRRLMKKQSAERSLPLPKGLKVALPPLLPGVMLTLRDDLLTRVTARAHSTEESRGGSCSRKTWTSQSQVAAPGGTLAPPSKDGTHGTQAQFLSAHQATAAVAAAALGGNIGTDGEHVLAATETATAETTAGGGVGLQCLLAVLPFRGGKSTVFLLSALLGGDGYMSLVILPSRWAVTQARDACRQSGVSCLAWGVGKGDAAEVDGGGDRGKTRGGWRRPDSSDGLVSWFPDNSARCTAMLLLVSVSDVGAEAFQSFFMGGLHRRRLRRVVMDDAQCLLFSSSRTRAADPVRALVGALGLPTVLLASALPPEAEPNLVLSLGLDRYSLVRGAPSLRPSLSYGVQLVASEKDMDWNIERHVRTFMATAENEHRMAVFAPCVQEAKELAIYLRRSPFIGDKAVFFDEEAPWSEQRHLITDWQRGQSVVMVTTVGFALGLSYPHLTRILHRGGALSLTAFAQETSRAGISGARSSSLLITCKAYLDRCASPVSAGKGAAGGKEVAEWALDETSCRRQRLHAILDGDASKTCLFSKELRPCDVCTKVLASKRYNSPQT